MDSEKSVKSSRWRLGILVGVSVGSISLLQNFFFRSQNEIVNAFVFIGLTTAVCFLIFNFWKRFNKPIF